jgi:hypothetical protein
LISSGILEGLGEFRGRVERGDGGVGVQMNLRKVGAPVIGSYVVTATDVVTNRHDVELSVREEMDDGRI